MILVDTSIWVDHLRGGNKALAALLNAGMVLAHPFVIGELALGNLRQREIVLKTMSDLPHACLATDADVLLLIDRHALFGRGNPTTREPGAERGELLSAPLEAADFASRRNFITLTPRRHRL